MDFKNVDIEVLIDKSGSMGMHTDCPGAKTRWKYGQETTHALAAALSEFDSDGITVVPFAGQFKVYEGVTADKVGQVFAENSPGGSTDTAAVLKNRLDAYFDRKAKGNAKSVCLLIMTDGEPDDQQAVLSVIVDATRKMDSDDEIALQFLQVGQDPQASAFLARLDDELVAKCGAKFDIVDTTKLKDVETMTPLQLLEKSYAD